MRPVPVFTDYLVKLVIPASRAILKPAVIYRCVSLIKTAFLNGEIHENEQFFCSPPPGFRVPDGMGWLIKKGLYGAHQSGSIWAKTFRTWMHKNYPQYVEAGNERCVYVMRESEKLAPRVPQLC